jgi:capsular polysaccharide biosynthesis protein
LPPTSFADRARVAVERFSIRNLTYALLLAVLLASLSAALSLRAPAEYRSLAVLLIDNPLALATSGNESTVNKLEQLRGKYATLANTEVIAGPVAEQLGMGVGAVITGTDVEPAPSTLSLVVAARGEDPERARALANAMATAIGSFVQAEHEQYAIPAQDRFVIKVVQEATPAAKVSPSTERTRTSAIIVFAVGLAVAYLALQFLRPPLAPGDRLPTD